VAVKKRGGSWFLYFDPFKHRQIGLKIDVSGKLEAKRVEAVLIQACRTANYYGLDPVSREACVRMFMNQGWKLPDPLGAVQEPTVPPEELTLWKGAEMLLKSPEMREHPYRWRYEATLIHLAEVLGKNRALGTLKVSDVKLYQHERLRQGAKAGTVNKELSTLSKIFQALIECEDLATNPVRLAGRVRETSGERQAYLSLSDMLRIVAATPPWFGAFVQVSYYTGMRRGEILSLCWRQVKLAQRMIILEPDSTKERHWKRIPLRTELIPVFEEAMHVRSLKTDRVFLIDGKSPSRESFKNPWRKACVRTGLNNPSPRFHDLRHSWKSNALASGMDPEIRQAIMGHQGRVKSVPERYGRIMDVQLLAAIDAMSFDHGETEILAAAR